MRVRFLPRYPFIKTFFQLTDAWVLDEYTLTSHDKKTNADLAIDVVLPQVKKACLECLIFMGFQETKTGQLVHPNKDITQIFTEIATLNFRAMNRSDGERTISKIYSHDSPHGQLVTEILYEVLNTLMTTTHEESINRICHNVYRSLILTSMDVPSGELRRVIEFYERIHKAHPTFWLLWYMHLVIKDRFIYTPAMGA